MSPVALLLVLAAAGFHAGWNRLLHDVEDRVAAMAIAGFVGCLVLLPAIVTSPPVGVPLLIALSAIVQTAYVFCLTAAYRRADLSLVYPIARGTAPLLVTLGGWLVLGQAANPMAFAGAAALGLGLTLVATGGRHSDRRNAVGYALLTGCCIAAYSLVDARAVRHVSAAGYLGVVLGLQGLLLTAAVRGEWSRLRHAWRPGVLIGIGTIGAYLLILLAFQRANAGPVATVREVSVLLVLVIARDRPGLMAWIGALLVVTGAILAVL